MFLDKNGNPIPNKSTLTAQAAGVPGSVAGMWALHQARGKLKWAELLTPAIQLAARGFPITKADARMFTREAKLIDSISGGPTAFTCPYRKEWMAGDTLRQPELAKTLQRIATHGLADFYTGETARLLVEDQRATGGLIAAKDLADYKPIWRKPLVGMYDSLRIITMAPPSSGGVILLQCLNMLKNVKLKSMGFPSAEALHAIVEAERRVYADRSKYLGDPDFFNVPVSQLLDTAYCRKRMQDFSPAYASTSQQVVPGFILGYESTETTHYTVADKDGNVTACTTTLNGGFGNARVVRGAGFLLNNEMDDFSTKPGVPNIYGVTGGSANAIQPGKRMLSSMTPTIVEKNGKFLFTVGTPGGSTIPASVLYVVLQLTTFSMPPDAALATPRLHHQWLPDHIFVEGLDDGAWPPDITEALKIKKHMLKHRGRYGSIEVIYRLPDGTLHGAADPRGDDTAMGY